jgi:hypothetical protein
MSDGEWKSILQIKDAIGRGTETSILARLRDSDRSGRWIKDAQPIRNGLWLYRLRKSSSLTCIIFSYQTCFEILDQSSDLLVRRAADLSADIARNFNAPVACFCARLWIAISFLLQSDYVFGTNACRTISFVF